MPHWDTIIVGHGLAGATLAWQLKLAGQSVLVIDRAEPVTASKIAAGLITPITGQRIALSLRIDEFLPKARAFYRDIQSRTGENFFHERPAVRLFSNVEETQRWATRKAQAAFQTHLIQPQPESLLDAERFKITAPGFLMMAAQLDVPRYLAASRKVLEDNGRWIKAGLDWEADVNLHADGVTCRTHSAGRIISCEGFAAMGNPHFKWVPFKAAKGEILTIKLTVPIAPRCVHRGLWMAPTNDAEVWRVGSTYDWHQLDQTPTCEGRSSIETPLREILKVPWEVIDHQAAVRPIIQESKAMLGLHPAHPALGFFNGLGSKGSLHAPLFAEMFARHLTDGAAIETSADLRSNF